MHVHRNHTSHRSLRATALTAFVALLATSGSACIFIDDIHVGLEDPTIPGPDTGDPHDSDAPHDSEGPCTTTGDEEEDCSCGDSGTDTGEDTERLPTSGDASTGDAPTGETSRIELCGNGVVDAVEACDDGVNDGAYGGCLKDCVGLAPHCGDGVLNDNSEACDDGNTNEEDECLSFCQPPTCGDGIMQANEQCDGSVTDATCESMGFSGGSVACDAACKISTEQCFGCGNGVIDGEEVCDGAELGGATCEALGMGGGVLACNEKCSELDSSGCTDQPPSPSDCCTVGEPGVCELVAVEACVCQQMPECCDLAWDESCVKIAVDACFATCG